MTNPARRSAAVAVCFGDMVDDPPTHAEMSSASAKLAQVARLGRYELIDRVAIGGMGAVFRARDTASGGFVAVKVMHEHLVERPFRWRFQREARLAASLWHPHIVAVRDHGRRALDGADQLYLVMDLVEGTTVGEMLKHTSVVPLGVWCALVGQLLEALAYVHARDVLHRDIKPSNLLVTRAVDGGLTLKVVDFGLAMELGLTAARITRKDQVLGTPLYMAPEQASGDELLGPAVDLYSVGVLLFQVLTGRPPFEGTPASVLVDKLRQPPPLDRLPDDTPETLRSLVADLLEREPERRPRSAAGVRARLMPHATSAHLNEAEWETFVSTVPDSSLANTVAVSGAQLAGAKREPRAPQVWGRDDERRQLEDIAERVEEGEPQMVVIEGEVGLGKSEIVQRFALALRQASRFHVVRATDLERGVVRAMCAAVEHTLRTTGRSRRALERAVNALLQRAPRAEDGTAEALVDLLRPSEVASGVNRHEQNLATLTQFLRLLASESPVLLVIEDAHEGGDDIGAFMRHLLFDLWSEPYVLLCVITRRPEPRRAETLLTKVLRELEAGRASSLTRVELHPLEDDVLLSGLAEEYDLGDTRRHAIVTLAAGNPAFARMLAGVEALPDDPTVGSADHVLPRQLRATLAVMLQERVADRESLRDLLQHLAVLGGEASAQLLATFVGSDASDTATIADGIDALVELQLVVEPAIDQLRLTHPTMRDVLLEGITPRRLRRLHLRAAALRKKTEADAGAIGDHLFAAAKPAEAVGYWLRAQKAAFYFGDCRQAAQWGQRAIVQMSPESTEHFDASLLLGRALREMTAYEAAVAVLEPLVESRIAPSQRLLAADLLGEVLQEKGDDEGWARCVAQIEADLPEEPGPARRAGLRALAFWSNHRLDVVSAQRYAEEALLGDDMSVDERVTALKRLFWACFYQVNFDRAKGVAQSLLALAATTGHSEIEAEGWRLLGKIHQETPAFDEAIAAFEKGLALYRRLGRQSRVINVFLDIMFVACTAERYEQAMDYVERFERVRPTTVLDYTGVIVRLTELRCRALGRAEPVAIALAELDEHVTRTKWGFRAAVRGEWISALLREARPNEARPMLDDFFRDVATLPPLVWNATHLELLAKVLASEADSWRREAAITSLDLAATIYRRLESTERAQAAEAKVSQLELPR